MDGRRFDRWTRALATRPPTRRALLRALAAGGLATGFGARQAAALRPPGRPCQRNSQCESAICRGRRGRKACRCDDGQPTCRGDCCGSLNVCDRGQCVSHCESGKSDGDESDVDCGGSRCPKCGVGRGCFFDTDCLSGICEAAKCRACRTDGQCNPVGPFCVDHVCRPCRGDAESVCPPGQFCVDNDCAHCRDGADCPEERPVCDRFHVCRDRCRRNRDFPGAQKCRSHRCGFADHCDNGGRDGDETDVDCGGSCRKCGVPQLCDEDSDCETGHCGSVDLGDGQGFRRRCAECFSDDHCPAGHVCSRPFCVD